MNFLPDGVNFNKDITYLAKTNFRNQQQVFGIKRKDRRQHMYVLGKSGTGKSVLLGNMIVQNILSGEGLAVVDPHGELVESILAMVPPERVKDVIYFNPADHDFHIGFNVLEIEDTRYKHLVASGLMGIFTKIWANAWSARMEYILNNCILALLDTPGSTLLGIPRLLVDKDYRQTIVNNIKDPVIKSFWVNEYEAWRDQYRNEAIAPIQNKVGQFLSTAMVRNVLGQAKSTINLFDAMNSGKIFLVNVSKGRIGEDNSALLGGMLITKLQLAAMERVRIPEDERRDFFLYVDEFQNFVTDSFASILSEARKYRLNLTLAHQYIAQLVTKESESVRDAVFGNVGTMIVFRVGAADADFLEKEFEPEFEIQDMVNLPNYNAYLKLMVDGITSRPFSALTLPPFKVKADSDVAEKIIESSRRLYAKPKEEVEKEIASWSGMLGDGSPATGHEGEGKFKAVCSACGKDTTVPFEPVPGRPVYCRDCIAKIKSGELKPLKGTRGKDITPQSFAALANLGIEFTADRASLPPQRPVTPPMTAPAPKPARAFSLFSKTPKPAMSAPAAHAVPARPSAPRAASPSPVAPAVPRPASPALKPVSRTAPLRDDTATAGLKDILKQALGDAIKKGEEYQEKKQAQAPIVPKPAVPEKKTISLAALKKPETATAMARPQSGLATKTASDGHVSALQEAIAKARASAGTPVSTPVSTPVQAPTPAPATHSAETATVSVSPTSVPVSQVTESVVPQEASAPVEAQISNQAKEHEIPTKQVKEIPEDILRSVLE